MPIKKVPNLLLYLLCCIHIHYSEDFQKFIRTDSNNLSFKVQKCSINNGGCSNTCINPTQEGENVTCSCVDTTLVLHPDGDQKTCGQ